jgi:hypothetical protein
VSPNKRQRVRGWLKVFQVLGPGLITGASDDDPTWLVGVCILALFLANMINVGATSVRSRVCRNRDRVAPTATGSSRRRCSR